MDLHCVPKKEATKLLAITINFSKVVQEQKLRCGGKYYTALLEILIVFSAMKEF